MPVSLPIQKENYHNKRGNKSILAERKLGAEPIRIGGYNRRPFLTNLVRTNFPGGEGGDGGANWTAGPCSNSGYEMLVGCIMAW